MISLIIPCFNAEKTIDRCLDSFLCQTYRDFEIIAVDDGSSDNTGKILDDYAGKDRRIKVIHKENTGVNLSRKVGFLASVGEFLCFPDSDDYAEPDYLEKLYNAFDEKTDIVICSYFTDYGKNYRKKIYNNRYVEKSDFVNVFVLPNIYYLPQDGEKYDNFNWIRMFRRRTVREEFFISQREYFSEDLFFNFWTLLRAEGIRIIDVPLYHYVVNDNSLTTGYIENLAEKLKKRNDKLYYFCKENSVMLIAKRSQGLIKNTIMKAVRNSVLKKSYKTFLGDCIKIRKDFSDYFGTENETELSQKEKIILFMLKYKLYPLLYLLMRLK